MDDDIAAALAQARETWPEIEIAPDAFIARLTALRADERDAELHVADIYLACACAAGVPAALAIVEREIFRGVPQVLGRFRGGAAFDDEVVQMLREKLLVGDPPRIIDYHGRSPLRAWVRVAATRLAIDLLRKRGAAPHEVELVDQEAVDPAPTPELDLLKARYRGEFQDAMTVSIAALTRKQRNLLRMHHVDGVSLDRLATAYRVHRATVARWLADARDEILTRTQDHLASRLELSPSEIDSLADVVRSQIQLSVSRLFRR